MADGKQAAAAAGLEKIIARAWRDPAFKAALITNPAAALKAEGIDVPAGMAVTVLENTDKQFHLVLPPKPTGELSDKDLDGVAGGFSGGMEGGMMAGWRISLGLTLYVMRRDKIGPFANDR